MAIRLLHSGVLSWQSESLFGFGASNIWSDITQWHQNFDQNPLVTSKGIITPSNRSDSCLTRERMIIIAGKERHLL